MGDRFALLHDGKVLPTRQDLREAVTRTVPDVLAPGIIILLCGVNPGLYSAAIGHHFGHPGNRFWPALHHAGLTERRYSPYEERLLLARHIGLINLVRRPTRLASELTREELVKGAASVRRKVLRYRPRTLAVFGLGAYRTAFSHPHAQLGRQEERIDDTEVWVLPGPSGLNAYYPPTVLERLLKEMMASERLRSPSRSS